MEARAVVGQELQMVQQDSQEGQVESRILLQAQGHKIGSNISI